jgi:hypothetical protein
VTLSQYGPDFNPGEAIWDWIRVSCSSRHTV